MASALLLIKNFCVVVYGSVSILAALVDLASGYCRVIDEFAGRVIRRNPQMMNTRLGTVKRSRWRRWRKVCLFPVRRCFVLTSIRSD